MKSFRRLPKKKKKETYSPQKHEWGTDASVKYAKQMTPGEQSEQTEKPMKSFSDIYESVQSADKKPQNYRDPETGKTKVRMVPVDKEIVKESHFKVGQKVKCKASGTTGEVIKVDPEEKGKYYTVRQDSGKVMKYAPDELTAVMKEEKEYFIKSFDYKGTKHKYMRRGSKMTDPIVVYIDGKEWKTFKSMPAAKKAALDYIKGGMKEEVELDEGVMDSIKKVVTVAKAFVPMTRALNFANKGDLQYAKNNIELAVKITAKNSDKSENEIRKVFYNLIGDKTTNKPFAKLLKTMGDNPMKEEVELDEAGYKVPKNYAAMMAKKRKKSGTSEFGKHPDIRKQLDDLRKGKGKIDYLKRVEEVELDEIYDTGGAEEVGMAVRQLRFIEYAAEEIMEYLEERGDMDEWFQNKLANVHMMMKGLYAYAEGDSLGMDYMDMEMDESVDGTRILSEPATSKAQQQAAGAALAAKRGDTDPSTLKGASKQMYKSMTKKELDDFASTKHKGLPTRKEENELGVLIPMEYDENNNLIPKQEGSALWDIRKKISNED